METDYALGEQKNETLYLCFSGAFLKRKDRKGPKRNTSSSHFLVLLWPHLRSFFVQTFHMKKKRKEKKTCWLGRIWRWEKVALLLF